MVYLISGVFSNVFNYLEHNSVIQVRRLDLTNVVDEDRVALIVAFGGRRRRCFDGRRVHAEKATFFNLRRRYKKDSLSTMETTRLSRPKQSRAFPSFTFTYKKILSTLS